MADALARLCNTFHRGLNNVDFNMQRNGELRVLTAIADTHPCCIFDVGANNGEWSRLASALIPNCTIHAFEIVPSTFQQLQAGTAGLKNVRVNNFGLSNENGDVVINISEDTSVATACRIEGMKAHDDYYRDRVNCVVRKASNYIQEQNIERIDFVKIDVEGMDLRVIRGFEDTLSYVRAIQFEYGVFNIASHDLLADFCALLVARGFVIGKIFPNAVQFFDYHFDMENFHGSNYVAVRSNENELLSKLSRNF